MPPILALLACVIFVLVLLRQDAAESAGVTRYLWVPTIWFLLICGKPLAIWFGSGGETIEEGSALDRVVLLALFAAALTTLIRRRFSWAVALREHKWLVLLLGFMLCSTVWSAMPFISFRRWFTSAIAVVMLLSVQTEPLPRVATQSLLRRIVYICIPLSYVLINYFPQYGRIYVHSEGVEMWTGVALHKNSLAELCVIGFLLISWRILTRHVSSLRSGSSRFPLYLDVAVLLMGLVVFMGPDRRITYAATAMIETVVGVCTLAFLFWHKGRGTQPAAALFQGASLLLICYGTLTPFLGTLSVLDVSSLVGRSSTLTGRTDIWERVRPAVLKQPLLGYGHGGFWTTEARETYDISDAHNGYLGLVLETGFVGLLLCALFLLSATRTAHLLLKTDFPWGALCLVFVLIVLIANVSESSLSSLTERMLAVFLLIHFSCYSGSERALQPLGAHTYTFGEIPRTARTNDTLSSSIDVTWT